MSELAKELERLAWENDHDGLTADQVVLLADLVLDNAATIISALRQEGMVLTDEQIRAGCDAGVIPVRHPSGELTFSLNINKFRAAMLSAAEGAKP